MCWTFIGNRTNFRRCKALHTIMKLIICLFFVAVIQVFEPICQLKTIFCPHYFRNIHIELHIVSIQDSFHYIQIVSVLIIIFSILINLMLPKLGFYQLFQNSQKEQPIFQIIESIAAAGLYPGDNFFARVCFNVLDGQARLHLLMWKVIYNLEFWECSLLLQIRDMDSKQLQQLLNASDDLGNSLNQLRNKIASNGVSGEIESPSQLLLEASHTRHIFRTLAETLEANRNLVQLNKLKIEKSRVFLEGLEYYKKTLRNKINELHIEAQPIDEYLEQPLGDIDWQNNYEQGQQRLKQSLDNIRTNNQKYRQGVNKRTELDKNIAEKRKLYRETIPRQVKNLSEQVAQTSKLFGCQLNQVLEKIDSPKLAYIFDEMKVKKKLCNIEVTYSKDEFQSLELIIKPSGMELYNVANQNKIKIEEKEIKIKIADLSPIFKRLVIGVDRRCDFNTKDIFTRLVNSEETKLIFQMASNQTERNFNNKYVYLEWVEDVLCASIGEGSNFIDIIRQRVFSLSMRKFLLQNMKKLPFFFQIPSSREGEVPIHLKKLNIDSVNTITFRQYKEIVFIPPVLSKALNSFEIAEKKLENRRSKAMMEEQFEDQYKLDCEKSKISSLLQSYHLSEMMQPNMFTYHRVCLTYYTLKVVFVILLPADYPNKTPEIKVISYERTDDKSLRIPTGIAQKGKFDISNTFSSQAQELEKQANSNTGWQSPMKGKVMKNFSLLLKINRILTVMARLQHIYHETHKKHD